MPEIGVTLREARMRARIDISEIETRTKIRAKYLRALENEEWNLLPGPAYVKSFLRTYADTLGLDSKLLLEEYKLRHERLSEVELQPIRPTPAGQRRPSPPRQIPRGWIVGGVMAALIVALYLLGRSAGDDEPGEPASTPAPPARTTPAGTTDTSSREERRPARRPRGRSRFVRLTIVATGEVYVCLEAAGGRRLIDGEILRAGRTFTARSSEFRVTFGNSNARVRVNGRLRRVAATRNGVGYRITRRGRTTLPAGRRPTCT